MNITFYIDKQGGAHYHLKNCPMVNNIAVDLKSGDTISSHYEPVERRVKFSYRIIYPNFILVDKKKYVPCNCVYLGCFGNFYVSKNLKQTIRDFYGY